MWQVASPEEYQKNRVLRGRAAGSAWSRRGGLKSSSVACFFAPVAFFWGRDGLRNSRTSRATSVLSHRRVSAGQARVVSRSVIGPAKTCDRVGRIQIGNSARTVLVCFWGQATPRSQSPRRAAPHARRSASRSAMLIGQHPFSFAFLSFFCPASIFPPKRMQVEAHTLSVLCV
ncbi:uncharacterized protein CIMG_12906 [Coccidioides immitis RS]|uniref:Uncharacterized protein n=1 Tax=Coccidioides immitis (strain RS) TaxID=246410 RepID=A0A0D8JSQ6_COCIM|nr:uncharacterized protein CIMG_12906 [Coccidioides immitis RS]KJF60380.1 hypothetical protein CIMG_12906 [Coccidioides immitis RS]